MWVQSDTLEYEPKIDWFPYQKELIMIIKRYPVIYTQTSFENKFARKHRADLQAAWKQIAAKLDVNIKTCKLIWTRIKLKYAKLQNLINTGVLSKEVVISHVETKRFFNGCLSYLDPYIGDITNEQIPFAIHKSINNIFGLITSVDKDSRKVHTYVNNYITHDQVKAVLKKRQSEQCDDLDDNIYYLQNIVENAIKHKLQQLIPVKSDCSVKTKNDNQVIDVENINATLIPNQKETSTHVNLGLNSELIIKDDIEEFKTENEDDDGDDDIIDENLTLANTLNETAVSLQHILPNTQSNTTVVDATANNNIIIDDPVNEINSAVHTKHTTTMRSIEHLVTDEYMRKFFSELGQVMSVELSAVKQTNLKSRINALLTNILEEE